MKYKFIFFKFIENNKLTHKKLLSRYLDYQFTIVRVGRRSMDYVWFL